MNGRRLPRSIASLFLLALALTTLPVPADSHAVLVRSIPPARSVLSRPPDRVELWFSERLEPAFSSASVWSASGAQVDRQDVRPGPDDPKRLSLALPTLEPGTYTVRFRVLSVDGHIVEASFPFTVERRP
jgi:methionine-rich copper-binding protein CopC